MTRSQRSAAAGLAVAVVAASSVVVAIVVLRGCSDGDVARDSAVADGRRDLARPDSGGADQRRPDVGAPDVKVSDSAKADTAAPDAGAVCPPSFAGCSAFTDLTAPAAKREVTFKDFEYTPKCIEIKLGQSVTFVGALASDTFTHHPLKQSCGPAPDVFLRVNTPDTRVTVTPTVVGVYGYYCLDHGNKVGQVMAGAIKVVP